MSGISSGAALAISAGIGLAGSLYTAQQQKSAQSKAQAQQQAALDDARKREEEMLAEQKMLDAQQTSGGSSLETVSYGTSTKDKVNTTYNSFLVTKSGKSQLGTSGTSGLGFSL